ncbi:hypothetical protein PInf_018929 [Phytophthora infestans]|nr:hypothetical protein PInf_018929 [Phytophthora infestans]
MTRDWSASVFAPADDFAVDPGSAKSYRINDEDLYVSWFEAAIDNLVKWRSRLRLGDVTMETPLSSDDADLSSAPTQVADKNTAEDNEINEEKDAEDEKESEEQQTEDVEVNKKKYVEG